MGPILTQIHCAPRLHAMLEGGAPFEGDTPSCDTTRVPLDSPGSFRILLVDDEPLLTRAIRRFLKRYLRDADIREVHDGARALQLLPEFQPHVVLLDLKMPEIDGLQVARRVQVDPAQGEPAVVVHSGSLDADTVAELERLGVRGCLPKPTKLQDILAAVLDALPRQEPARQD